MEDCQLYTYYKDLSAGLMKSWEDSNYTDVEVKVDNRVFSCHRIVLAAMSHYFSTMFGSGFKESSEKTVLIQGIDSETFERVLSYIYTGQNQVTTRNVYNLLNASSLLQIKGIQKSCENFYLENLGTSNCIETWKLAVSHGLPLLADVSWRIIIEKFPTVSKTEEFVLLDKEDLIKIIDNKGLYTPSEEYVCDAVMVWMRHNISARKNQLVDVLKYLKFSQMSLDYLCNIRDCKEIEDASGCRTLIMQAIDKANSTDAKDLLQESSFRDEEIMCMVGTRSRHPDPQKTEVKCYSFRHDKKFKFADLPVEPGPCFAVCTLNNDIYVSGGYIHQNLLLHFNSKTNTWKEYYCLIDGRWCHSMASIGNNLYLLAGMSSTSETLSSIETFDTTSKKCIKVGNLQIPVSSSTAAVIGSKIYLFGGKLTDRTAATVIQYFDVASGQSCIVGDLPLDCAGNLGRAVSYQDGLILVFREGSVVEYKEGSQPLTVCSVPKFDHFGAVISDKNILVLGNQSGTFKSVLVDPIKKESVEIPTAFKAPMCNFYCLKIIVSKAFLI